MSSFVWKNDLHSPISCPVSLSLQAKDIMNNYQTGVLENSAKMLLLFHLIDESVSRGDKILVFRLDLSLCLTWNTSSKSYLDLFVLRETGNVCFCFSPRSIHVILTDLNVFLMCVCLTYVHQSELVHPDGHWRLPVQTAVASRPSLPWQPRPEPDLGPEHQLLQWVIIHTNTHTWHNPVPMATTTTQTLSSLFPWQPFDSSFVLAQLWFEPRSH